MLTLYYWPQTRDLMLDLIGDEGANAKEYVMRRGTRPAVARAQRD
jgi:hypothetical protein